MKNYFEGMPLTIAINENESNESKVERLKYIEHHVHAKSQAYTFKHFLFTNYANPHQYEEDIINGVYDNV